MRGAGGGAGMFKIAKPLVTGVAKDDRFTLSSKDYTVLTGGQSQRWGLGGWGGTYKRQHALSGWVFLIVL